MEGLLFIFEDNFQCLQISVISHVSQSFLSYLCDCHHLKEHFHSCCMMFVWQLHALKSSEAIGHRRLALDPATHRMWPCRLYQYAAWVFLFCLSRQLHQSSHQLLVMGKRHVAHCPGRLYCTVLHSCLTLHAWKAVSSFPVPWFLPCKSATLLGYNHGCWLVFLCHML
jgi:hypothetical protein